MESGGKGSDAVKRPTVVDVARAAGVALGTVSRVLNAPDSVSPENRRRVEQTIARLQYSPLRRRKGGRYVHRGSKRKGVVGVVFAGLEESDGQSPVLSDALRGVEEAVAGADESLMLATVPRGDRVPVFLMDDQVDGLIVRVPFIVDWRERIDAELLAAIEKLPHVWLAGQPAGARGDSVDCDFDAVGRIAAEHLHACGHRHAACLVPRKGWLSTATPQETFWVYARRHGFAVDWWEQTSSQAVAWPVKAIAGVDLFEGFVDRWLDLAVADRPTVFVIGTDASAKPLYSALRERGVQAGRDVSVISLCREPVVTMGIEPGLTTIENFGETIGRRAVQQLRWRLDHLENPVACRTRIQPELAEDGSVVRLAS